MNLPLQLARRYLFGKKSTNAINLISGISIFGLTIGTAALIIILSVFNGFEQILSGLFNPFNPDIEITTKVGKTAILSDSLSTAVAECPYVESYSVCIEDLALFQYDDIQEIGTLKGVDSNYIKVTNMDTAMLYGDFKLKNDRIPRGVVGAGLRNKLGLSVNQAFNPLTVYTILKKPKAGREFNTTDMYPAGVFSTKSENDFSYVITDYGIAANLFEKPNAFSSIEIKLKDDDEVASAKQYLAKALPDCNIKPRTEQDAAFLKILRIEKWIAFLIVSLTMVLIAFNLIGSLWMIVLDKRKDIAVLRSMGFTSTQVRNTFLLNGVIMCIVGYIIGATIAIAFYLIQTNIGLIGVPDGFVVSSYPIRLRWTDFAIVLITVVGIGTLGSLLPALRAARIGTDVRSE